MDIAVASCLGYCEQRCNEHGPGYLSESAFYSRYMPSRTAGSHGSFGFSFWETSILFPIVATPTYIPTTVSHTPFSAHSSALVICRLSKMAILTGVRWHSTVLLICIALIITDTEHLFHALLGICISSLEEYLFRSSAHFWLFFCHWVLWTVCVFWNYALDGHNKITIFMTGR